MRNFFIFFVIKNLLQEIHTIIDNLTQYANAMEANDAKRLCSLLRDGRIAKELSEKN